jgi:dihydroorotate dehydrogenase (NAD+) catalytic subunit
VGIPSLGVERFRAELLPRYQALGAPVIVSIGGLGIDEFFAVADGLRDADLAALEVNVSCPNLEAGGLAVGTSPDAVAKVVSGVRQRSRVPVIVKLTPAVSSIAEVAIAAEDAGADALTVANSFPGAAIDLVTRRPLLGRGGGGYSGPGIKPIAIKLVADTAAAVAIPVIGCGGITTAEDVAEFLIAGASAVQVGTATFTRPTAMTEILADLPDLLVRLGVRGAAELVGSTAGGEAAL